MYRQLAELSLVLFAVEENVRSRRSYVFVTSLGLPKRKYCNCAVFDIFQQDLKLEIPRKIMDSVC